MPPQGLVNQPVSAAPQSAMSPQPKPKTKLWKKVLFGFGIFIVVIVAVAYFLPNILSLLSPGDAPLADESLVRLQKISVPDNDNGFYDFSQIDPCTSDSPTSCKSIITIPQGFNDLAYTNYATPVKWDQTAVDAVLQQNQRVFTLFDQAVSKNYFQIPDYEDPANLKTSLKFYPMNSWRVAARLQAIKALSLSYQGHADQALIEAVKINKLGSEIVKGHNDLIGALVGTGIQDLGSDTILQILPYGSSTKETLAQVQEVLKESGNDVEGYKDAFRFEYTHMANIIDETWSKDYQSKIQAIAGTQDTENMNPVTAHYINNSYYFKPNMTKNLFNNLYSQEVSAVGEKCGIEGLDEQLSMQDPLLLRWKMIFTKNVVGRIIFYVTGLSLSSAIEKQCQADLATNAVQLELALKEYEIDNGSLPPDLNSLVSQYIAAVPQDPFDHQPIRYNAQKKILYSVGLNGKDLGGSKGNNWRQMDNPTFPIQF